MNTKRMDELYSEIANILNEIIPVKWSKVLMYWQIAPGYIGYYGYFYELEGGNLKQFTSIEKEYDIDENSYSILKRELNNKLEELNDEFAKNTPERWSTFTFILESTGKAKMEFGYEDITKIDELKQRDEWEKKYLGYIYKV